MLSSTVGMQTFSVGTSEAAAPPNPIVTENQNTGTTAWQIPQSGYQVADDATGQIKGYASATSVNTGDAITLFVSTAQPENYTVDVYRLGWYGGTGGRLMTSQTLAGTPQASCPLDAATGLIECSWNPSTQITTTGYTSGLYVGVLSTATTKFQNYVVFTVRDDARHSPLLYQQAVTTYEAFNSYSSNGTPGPNFGNGATKVSFDRPYSGDGSGYLLRADINMIRRLELAGYDVAYSTDIDTHEAGARLLDHQGFLSVGHDEFWSSAMFDAVEAARDHGVNLAFFGANSVADRISFAPSSGGTPDRVMVADDTFQNLGRPEQTLLGVQTGNQSAGDASYVISHADNWIYAGTGFNDGDAVPNLVSAQSDRFDNGATNAPPAATDPNTGDPIWQLVSNSPVTDNGSPATARSSVYQATSGAWVFAAGTNNWSFALDDFGGHTTNGGIQLTTDNILGKFLRTSYVEVTSSKNPSTAGDDVTFTATIRPATATGTMTFRIDGADVGTGPISGGQATFTTTSAWGTGQHSIRAVYPGDANLDPYTSAAFKQTERPATTTTLASGPNPSTFGQEVTLTATVAGAGSTPTGTVTFKDGVTTLGTGSLDNAGHATLKTSALTVGSHSITAGYGGDTDNGDSTSTTVSQTVDKATTSAALGSSANPSTAGQSVTFTATVTPGSATGTVTFKDGSTTLGTGSLSGGKATLTTSALTAGGHSITAVYGGDANLTGSTSSAVSQTVNKVANTVTLGSSANPSAPGQSVTFTATVTPGSPTGTVTFKDGATTLGTGSLSGGKATLTTAALSNGSHSITAVYGGDATNAGSTSAPVTQAVNKVATATATASDANPSAPGQSVTFTATVTPSSATGTVTFFDGATSLGTGTLSGGKATLTTAALSSGTHSITAVYGGDATNAGSTSAALTQTVNKVASTTALGSSLNPALSGQSVTFTATVTPSSATGTVTFFDGATSLGTGTLSGGEASLTTAALSNGSHSITAVYGGDATNAGSSAAALTQTVNSQPVVPPTQARNGYWMVGSTGDVFAFGDAASLGSAPMPAGTRATNMTATPSGNGYWVVNNAGKVFAFGDAAVLGGNPPLAAGESVTSISSSKSGAGYWLFTSAGRVFPFGDAQFLGDMTGVRLNGPVLGSVATPSGNGYYMVASDGGIFAFGDASFHGSMGNQHLNGPVVGLAPDPDGAGYWLVANDGGIFAFDAPFRGSMGSTKLNKPVIGMVAYGDGYLMVAADGGIFDFSSKPFVGSLGGNPPANPIVAVTPIP